MILQIANIMYFLKKYSHFRLTVENIRFYPPLVEQCMFYTFSHSNMSKKGG